jgi:hypothetical protein
LVQPRLELGLVGGALVAVVLELVQTLRQSGALEGLQGAVGIAVESLAGAGLLPGLLGDRAMATKEDGGGAAKGAESG